MFISDCVKHRILNYFNMNFHDSLKHGVVKSRKITCIKSKNNDTTSLHIKLLKVLHQWYHLFCYNQHYEG